MITGLIFVRFSRPTARMRFSKVAVIAPFDGVPNLMIRLANLRHQAMVEPEFRMIFLRNITTAEGDEVRRFRSLKLEFDHLIAFPAVLTVRHRIDEESPLFGMTPEDFQQQDIHIVASIVGVDTVIVAPSPKLRGLQLRTDSSGIGVSSRSLIGMRKANGRSTMPELTKPKISRRFRTWQKIRRSMR